MISFMIFEWPKLTHNKKMDKSLHKHCNIIALLERIPLISYTGKEPFISENYYYLWNINNTSKFCSYILNYEFLTEQTYNKKVMLYDENVSIPINKVNSIN